DLPIHALRRQRPAGLLAGDRAPIRWATARWRRRLVTVARTRGQLRRALRRLGTEVWLTGHTAGMLARVDADPGATTRRGVGVTSRGRATPAGTGVRRRGWSRGRDRGRTTSRPAADRRSCARRR